MSDISIATLLDRALAHQNAGRSTEAEEIYRAVLVREPHHPAALHMLGILVYGAHGNIGEALDLVQRSITSAPNDAMVYCTLGQMLAATGRAGEAIGAFEKSLAIGPDPSAAADVQFELAKCLHSTGRSEQSIASCRQVLAARPDYIEALNFLGTLVYSAGRTQEAIVAFQRAIALKPDFHIAHNNLGNALHDQWRLDEAEASLRRAIALQPDFDLAHGNLGNVLKDLGRLEEALSEMRAAIALNPRNSISHSNLLFAIHFHPEVTPQQILQEHRVWNERHARPAFAQIRPHGNDRSPDRRLRLGYVSADFREHPVGRCLLPILTRHDRQAFDLTCYSGTHRIDATTDAFRSVAVSWRDAAGWSDERLAAQVREDRIDILIDLALHSEGGRPLTFARKPAPVQVAFAGYPGTTGLEAMDYRISDAYMDEATADRDALYVEKTIRLPHSCFGCFDPERGQGGPTAVNPPPCKKNGFVTFVSLNNFAKVSDVTMEMWLKVMRALPSARLLVRAPAGSAQMALLARFKQQGIAPPRIGILGHVPRSQYFSLFHQFDVFLDTFPYTGHTTTIDALWMGVPVVSRAGQTAVSRGSLSILGELGLAEWAASDTDEYVGIAIELAGNFDRLRSLRSSLRDRLRASAVMDVARFTKNLEVVYRQIWKTWCLSPLAPPQ